MPLASRVLRRQTASVDAGPRRWIVIASGCLGSTRETGRVPRQSLELLPDPPGRTAVRAIWRELVEAGLPSQADHRGQSNEVHLTLLEGDDLGGVLPLARRVVGPLLPLELPVRGTTVLGSAAKQSLAVALTLEVPPVLSGTVEQLRAALPDPPSRAWLPHVTLARRLDAEAAERVTGGVGALPPVLTFTVLRHWDPATRTLQTLS